MSGNPSGDSVQLQAATVRVDLLERDPGSASFPGDGRGRRYERHWTPLHLDLVVGDVAAAVQTVQAAGGTLESEPTEIGREVIATCADPFGNGFCLVEYRNG